ncbi:metal-dependent hydrolase [Azospirillum soli]|uniref:metal-dependent hydrolase n=1 Tax=Azospirillum soli TaxID=1304799 RepID=UPI001B3B4D2F
MWGNRTWTHTAWAVVAYFLALLFAGGLDGAKPWSAIAWGCASHVVADSLTKGGVPLFLWPASEEIRCSDLPDGITGRGTADLHAGRGGWHLGLAQSRIRVGGFSLTVSGNFSRSRPSRRHCISG